MATVDEAVADYGNRTITRIVSKTGAGSISKQEEADCMTDAVEFAKEIVGAMIGIVDDMPDFVAQGFRINNGGDATMTYQAVTGGDILNLLPADIYNFPMNDQQPNLVPLMIFDDALFYNFSSAPLVADNSDFMSAADAQIYMAQFNLAFINDYIASTGGRDLFITNKNLVVNVSGPTARALISQLQVIDITDTVIWDGQNELGNDFIYLGSDLNDNQFKVVIASSDATMIIQVQTANGSIITRYQNFASDDPENLFDKPVKIFIFEPLP